MKLRNRKTGEVVNIYEILTNHDTLAELNEEWEDYDDQKEDYIRVIDSFIHYVEEADSSFDCDESVHKFVEKLKAWKRLKDKGFRFDSYDVAYKVGDGAICGQVYFKAGNYDREEIENDLYLLFGGEE